MARKPKEVPEEEIQVTQVEKKETFVTRWFKTYAVNNPRELKLVCDLTSRSASDQFSMYLPSNNTEVYAVVFYATFKEILKFIKSKQKTYKNFTLEIGNSINVGYTINDDESFENGNFTPIMEYIGINRNIVNNETISINRTEENLIRWKELNIKKNVEYYKEIQESAFNTLKTEYKTGLRTSEAVIPLFCIFMDHIINVLKTRWKESEGLADVSEISMDVFGLFKVYYSFDEEENNEVIDFDTKLGFKLGIKDDNNANID